MNRRDLTVGRHSERDRPQGHRRPTKAGHLQSIVLALILPVLATGCQATQDCGLLRVWTDVNSLGGPAAYVDQFRTDGFRTASPATGLPELSVIDVPHPSYHSVPSEFEVIPMAEPFDEASSFSGAFSTNADGVAFQQPDAVGSANDSDLLNGDLKSMSHTMQQSANRVSIDRTWSTRQAIKPAGAWLF